MSRGASMGILTGVKPTMAVGARWSRILPSLVLLGVWLGSSGPAHAAESATAPPTPPNVQAALQTLLAPQVGRADPALREVPMPAGAAALASSGGSAPGTAANSAAAAGSGRVVVNVVRGQSLDALLRQHLAASPLRVEVLRELVRQLNPQAFAPGAGYRLQSGARLQLPSPLDQAQHAFGKVLAMPDASLRRRGDDPSGPESGGAAAAARKGWVRYP